MPGDNDERRPGKGGAQKIDPTNINDQSISRPGRSSTSVFLCRAWLPTTGQRCGQWVPDGAACPNRRRHSQLLRFRIGRRELAIDPAHIGFRIFQEEMAKLMPRHDPQHWRRIAVQYDEIAGIPRLPLNARPEDLEGVPEAAQVSLACRRHAFLLETYPPGDLAEEIAYALGRVA
jgi:hypothetical protein